MLQYFWAGRPNADLMLWDMNGDAQNMNSSSSYKRCPNSPEDLECTKLDEMHGKVAREMC